MINEYETIYIDGLLLPLYTSFTEVTKPNLAKNITLDGSMYVDFYNNRRCWKMSWDILTIEEYAAIRVKYDKQFTSQIYLPLDIVNKGIYVFCYMNIDDKKIKYNGRYVEDFSIMFEEQHAIS
jgi:hypothetical protein